MKITCLRANHFDRPLGCDLTNLSLSWIPDSDKATRAVRSRVRIAADPSFEQILHDSGEAPLDSLAYNPALFAEIRAAFEGRPAPFDPAEKRARAAAFAEELAALYASQLCGPAPLLGRLKELWGWLHRSFEAGDDGLRRIQRARTPAELLAAARDLAGR